LFNYIYKKEDLISKKKFNHRTQTFIKYNLHEYINLALDNFDKSIMRFIRPYDIKVDDNQLTIMDVDLYNVKNRDNNPKSETKNIGITLECLWPYEDQPAYDFQLNIAEPFVQKYIANYSSCFPIYSHDVFKGDKILTIHHLFKIINEYTFNHIEKEIQFFSKYTHKEGIDKGIIATLNNLRNKTINNKRSCILRMSYGSGLHGITGDWLFDSHEIDDIRNENGKNAAYLHNRKTAKSRRIIDSYVLGFVELILPDEIPDIENPFQ